MPRQYLMSWIPKQRRWMKMHRGKRYAVSCRQLNTPSTKEDSWRAANEWWKNKLGEIEVASYEPHPFQTTLDLLGKKREWALRHGQPDLANQLSLQIEGTQKLSEADEGLALDTSEVVAKNIEIARMLGIEVPNDLDPDFAAHYFGDRRIWQERLSRNQGEKIPADRTVGGQVDRWVQMQQKLAEAGKITPDRADNNRIALHHFRDFLNAGAPVDVIDAQRLHDYFLFCLGKVGERHKDPAKKAGWSTEYVKKLFGVARAFIKFLWESKLIELPRNIDSRKYRFKASTKKVPTLTVEEFVKSVDNATGQLKLHLLLMANCGMCQTDISDLKQSEVDWVEGRIARKRSKTKDAPDVPEVNYKLWPITFDLLKRFRSSDPEYALLTESGHRWVGKALIDGRLSKADNIASCYVHLKKKTGIRKPLKLIRKTSASLIESHKEYGRYKSHFLGHSPRTIADKHYAAPSVPLFDEIVDWLGRQYGFVASPQ
jgi:integrase